MYCFTPLIGVLFTFPSRYWFTIGHVRVFRLGGWSPHVQTGSHVSRPTRVLHHHFRIRGCQDRKSTRLNSVTNAHLVCRLLLEKKKKNENDIKYNHTLLIIPALNQTYRKYTDTNTYKTTKL